MARSDMIYQFEVTSYENRRNACDLPCALFSCSLPVLAHHSFAAEYDSKKTITIHGIVQKVAWVNPHAYVWVDVKDENGKVVTYAFESLSPNALWRVADGPGIR